MRSEADELTPRQREILDAARELLREEGVSAMTPSRLAARLWTDPDLLWQHFTSFERILTRLVAAGFAELNRRFADAGLGMHALAVAYRGFASENPHLYRLMMNRPLKRELLPDGVETRSAAPILLTAHDQDLARACWAFAHGMVSLELDDRFVEGADLEAAWTAGLAALTRAAEQAGPPGD